MTNENERTGTPFAIPEEHLSQLTVADLKEELRSRDVCFQSKMRKQGLLELLKDSLHLPVDPEKKNNTPEPAQGKKSVSKAKHWKTDAPVRKLLYFEFKEGIIPLDPNEMGPAEIYCKYHRTEEFAGIVYDDLFVQRLKSLRLHVMKEEPLLKWNEYHPARHLLADEIDAGRIPLDTKEMGAAQVWCRYHDTAQFKMRGMKFNETFKRRLGALRKQLKKDKDRAGDDLAAVRRAIKNHPAAKLNHRGEPQWNGSKAQRLLKEDIAAGKHLEMEPRKLRLMPGREAYRAYSNDTFRWKIHQIVRTNKCLYTLQHDAEQKLRKNLK